MYTPKHFSVTDENEIFSFIEKNAFGQLISQVKGRLFSTHIPFLLSDDRQHLLAHFARQNPQLEELGEQEVMITLEGPHDYISPSWYEEAGVPTWNFQTVHIYGTCKIFNDAERLQTVVNDLTHKYESGFDQPWQPQYNPKMLNAITGVEITITDIQCKYKLSQNRSKQDQAKVIQNLEDIGSKKLAEAMKRI